MRIDGNKLAEEWKRNLKSKIRDSKIKPRLLIILMSQDEDSVKYVELKKKVGEEIGIMISTHSPESPTGANTPGEYSKYDGVVVQRPKKVDKKLWEELVNQIPLDKDVDGLREDSKWKTVNGRRRR
jgi:methylenetetrahydrofolate dehydrogenase (NADP+)/methenyltetrahydrofolate cyclohydrolase